MKCQSIWKFFCPTTLCSLFHGYVEECCVIPPWTKASERYISFFNQEGGIGIFGFGVLAIFNSVFRFCRSFLFADFTQFSIWFTRPDPWSSLWSDPIRSGPIQILSTPQGSFFIALSPVLTGKRPKWWDVPLLISFYCMPQWRPNKTSSEKMFLAFIASFLLPSDLYVGKYLLFARQLT